MNSPLTGAEYEDAEAPGVRFESIEKYKLN
jgi:hypothetical protein